MQHLDDSVDQHCDRVAKFPVFLVEQLEAHLTACEYVEVLKSIDHPHLGWFVGVGFGRLNSHLVVSALHAGVFFALENNSPFSKVFSPFIVGKNDGPDGGVYFFIVFILHRLDGFIVLVFQTL